MVTFSYFAILEKQSFSILSSACMSLEKADLFFLYKHNFSLNSWVEKIAQNPQAACETFPINTLDIAKVYV